MAQSFDLVLAGLVSDFVVDVEAGVAALLSLVAGFEDSESFFAACL